MGGGGEVLWFYVNQTLASNNVHA